MDPIDTRIGSLAFRYSMWVELTNHGEEIRGAFSEKADAIESAGKYWLTAVGLFRAFVRDRDDHERVIFNRAYTAQKECPRKAPGRRWL